MSNVKLSKDGEAASVSYLHNAMGQRVFKSEIQVAQTLPDEATLGAGFVAWLRSQFKWMFVRDQGTTSVGTAYTYGDGELPEWALLGEYDNGSASGAGRFEYIWLPTPDGAIPIGMFRNGKLFAIHPDHLGTPRLMTNDAKAPVWQWPYSAFGNNKPTGILKATDKPRQAMTNQPVLLRATAATEMNLRMPGQYFDVETGAFENFVRTYDSRTGQYLQPDPIGLAGGSNRVGYVAGNPLTFSDPFGLARKGGKTGQWWEYTDRNFQRWFHQCVKAPGDPDASREDLADAYELWVQSGKPDGKSGCGGPPPPPPPAPAETCGDSCQKTAAVLVVGGSAYVVYRCLRMLPSLLPPLWPTIPANVVLP